MRRGRFGLEDNAVSQDDTSSHVDYYNHLWINEWQDMERLNPTSRHFQNLINNLIVRHEPVRTLLDVGCGMGMNVAALRRALPGAHVTGADLSDEILQIARDYVGPDDKVDFEVLDIANGSLPRTFDLVLCNQVLEHVEDDRAALRNLVALSERWVLITVPGGYVNSTSRLNGHHRHYSRRMLLDLTRGLDLRIHYVRNWGFPFHSLYKFALGSLPLAMQKKVGLGKYGLGKKILAETLFLMFYGNVLPWGENVILLAEKPEPAPG